MNVYDELTGLLTRASFLEKLEEAMHGEQPLVLVHCDLDHLMEINEKYGHQGGDQWLKAIGERFGEGFGSDALTARYRGDEFVAVVSAGTLDAVAQMAEALRQRIENEPPVIKVNGESVCPRYTITQGIAEFPASASDPNDLIEKARTAINRGKRHGGNQVVLYQENEDSLTGLLNKAAAQRALEDAVTKARAAGEPLSVLLIDVDRFKEINDEFGHRIGDEVLKRLAHILENNFKAVGTVGRMSGDEFIVIMPGQPADSAFIMAEDARRLVEDSEISIRTGTSSSGERTYTLRFRISGGIATLPQDANDPVDLLRKADEALYRSKRIGRNRIAMPASAQMVTKTSYYTQVQLEQLAQLAHRLDKTEAFLLREALDDLFRKYKR